MVVTRSFGTGNVEVGGSIPPSATTPMPAKTVSRTAAKSFRKQAVNTYVLPTPGDSTIERVTSDSGSMRAR